MRHDDLIGALRRTIEVIEVYDEIMSLPDCIREMCVVDGEEITVSIKRDMAEYHREYYREKRKEYHMGDI